MKVRFLGKTEVCMLTHGEVYDVISIENGDYRIVDDTGEDYIYFKDMFEIVEENG